MADIKWILKPSDLTLTLTSPNPNLTDYFQFQYTFIPAIDRIYAYLESKRKLRGFLNVDSEGESTNRFRPHYYDMYEV